VPHVQRSRPSRRGSPRRLEHALEHTLAMSTATTEREIFDHTLTAVCEITPADVGVVLQPDGGRCLHGDPTLARALADAAVRSRCCIGRPGGMTSDFAVALFNVALAPVPSISSSSGIPG